MADRAVRPGSPLAPRRFEMKVHAPFRLDLTAWTLRRRPHNAVDRWEGTRYERTVVIGGAPVDLSVRSRPGSGQTRLLVDVTSARRVDDGVVDGARGLLRRTLGLDRDLDGFYALAERDPRLAALARRFMGMRPPRFPSVFEALVNAIACQQLSLDVGIHLLNRLSVRYGPSVGTGRAARPTGFPAAERLALVELHKLREMGFSWAKARSLLSIAERSAAGEIDLESLEDADDADVRAALGDLPGIGRWSTEYVMLRGLGRLHVLPGDDVGARNNLQRQFGLGPSAGYSEIVAFSQRWSPYGGLVYFHLLLDRLAAIGKLTVPR